MELYVDGDRDPAAPRGGGVDQPSKRALPLPRSVEAGEGVQRGACRGGGEVREV